jgi:ELWxxDGT repeat protein
LLTDIVAGSGSSYPSSITSLGNGSALFQANDGTNGSELWITDGTTAGTSLLKDIDAGSGSSSPSFFAVLTAPCFVTGTLIATPDGQRPVESLRKGDLVLTHAGKVRPVNWVGLRHLDLTQHPAPQAACPIRITAGALADGIPARDLRVSPEHAMYLLDGLVPARFLVNGATILRETDCRRVTYHHIQLETHDILVAEGAPSESYLDTGNRGQFENSDAPLILHPLFEDGQEGRIGRSCAPFLDDAAVLEPLWRGLADRAAMLGYPVARPVLTDDAAPRIAVGGRELRPVSVRGDVHTFVVPAGVETIRLLSHATVPGEVTPWVGDSRALGLSVRRIRVTEGAVVTDVALDHPGLTDGWWALEVDAAGTRRWTSGDAVLPVGPGGIRVLQITAGRMGGYVAATRGTAGTQALAA